MMSGTPTDFVVLSGFLGSGKTTLLERYLATRSEGDTAVIVNDVGEVNIDGAVLALREGVPMATLSNGCVCCSLTNDLQATVQALLQERQYSGMAPLRRVILECSGISEPGAILRTLSGLAWLNMCVSVVTTYDASQTARTDAMFELAAAQLAAAHVVVLTKLDLVEGIVTDEVLEKVSQFAPFAQLVVEPKPIRRAQLAFECPAGKPDWARLATEEEPMRRTSASSISTGAANHPRLGVFKVTFTEPLGWNTLEAWLENLVGYFDGRLLRMKGIVDLRDCSEPVLIQGVGPHVDMPRRIGSRTHTSSMVLIVRDATRDEVASVEPRLPIKEISRQAARNPIRVRLPGGCSLPS
ncbi:CobW family GTP-binding protein [Ralstonia flaminis]|jgi:G3E family GTPase|uniref:P-loop guanosine triphosphatase YjiA n=1 Tax=Ralstonia flaminis TaxID=3058597 RepID=A0ABM9JZS0_9RALS|nr:GTP-binding protein [Ralstonia sp. LMG 18101]CAJ0809017.1 P-loop guanosine triphosphatase YjiA [Ralstonia sp. LMG 18101]